MIAASLGAMHRSLPAEVYDAARRKACEEMCLVKDWPWVSQDVDVQLFYLEMRLAGESHNMAEILALRKPPRCMTDSIFNEGHCNGSQFADDPEMGDLYKRVADEHGVSITGKHYVSGAADYQGDPRAWVSGRGELKALLEERGWGAQGAVSLKARGNDCPDTPENYVDPTIIQDEVEQRIVHEQMLGCRDAEELTEKLTTIRQGHGPIEDD